jgi:hypothetical protein
VSTNHTPTNTHILRENENYRPLVQRATQASPELEWLTKASMEALATALAKAQTTSKWNRRAS